jgi:hypothetical protein
MKSPKRIRKLIVDFLGFVINGTGHVVFTLSAKNYKIISVRNYK